MNRTLRILGSILLLACLVLGLFSGCNKKDDANQQPQNGRVTINGVNVKPSRPLKEGEVVSVKKPPVTYSFRVLKCIEQRVGAKLLPEIYENVTDPKQYEILEMSRISGFINRARGTGRPTKKDRRSIEAFVEPALFGFDDDEDWNDEMT